MPQMGESVTEGTVLEWHKQEGEFVSEGETVVEVSTDKIDAEVPAPASGVITKILKAPPTTRSRSARRSPSSTRAPSRPETAPPRRPTAVASRGPGSLPGLLAKATRTWATRTPRRVAPAARRDRDPSTPAGGEPTAAPSFRSRCPRWASPSPRGRSSNGTSRRGRRVSEGDTVVEVSTDKVDAEVPAPTSGMITKILVPARRDRAGRSGAGRDDRWRCGARRRRAGRGRGHPSAAPAAPATDGGDGRRASPVARRVAAASGVDLGAVHGSAPGGKVTKADVLAAANGERRRGGDCVQGGGHRRRDQAASRSRRDARPGDEREPLGADGHLVPHPPRRRPRREAQGAERCAQGARR